MGSRYKLTKTCKACGFKETKMMMVWGDFDGWSEKDRTIQEGDCPCCIKVKQLSQELDAISHNYDELYKEAKRLGLDDTGGYGDLQAWTLGGI